MTTFGKYRLLTQCSTDAGHFTILAIDHRDNLLTELNKHAPAPLTDAEFTAFKQQAIRALAPHGSAVLTDPVYGFGPGVANGAIGGRLGLLSPLEVTDYSLHPSRRQPRIMPDWTVAQIKRAGAQGIKLLVFYHPETAMAADVRALVSRVVDECARHDIPLFLEPLAYSPDESKTLSNDELRQVVVDAAKTFSALGADILKLQFPASEGDELALRAALAEVDAACAVPWTLLSAGVDYATFYSQARLACEAGASGVIVGRAVWADAVRLQGEARAEFLRTEGPKRVQELAALCAEKARDWRSCVAPPDVAIGWHEAYAG